MTDRPRYFVTLSATCAADQLQTVVDQLSTALPGLARDLPQVEGLSLSFTREDADEFTTATVGNADVTINPDALPVAGPVTSTGPGTAPPDATPKPIVPDTSWRDPQPADAGEHAAPEEQG